MSYCSYRLLSIFLFFSLSLIAMEQRRFISISPEQCLILVRQRCAAERAQYGDSRTERELEVFLQDCRSGKDAELILKNFQLQKNSHVLCNVHLKSKDIMQSLQAAIGGCSLDEQP